MVRFNLASLLIFFILLGVGNIPLHPLPLLFFVVVTFIYSLLIANSYLWFKESGGHLFSFYKHLYGKLISLIITVITLCCGYLFMIVFSQKGSIVLDEWMGGTHSLIALILWSLILGSFFFMSKRIFNFVLYLPLCGLLVSLILASWDIVKVEFGFDFSYLLRELFLMTLVIPLCKQKFVQRKGVLFFVFLVAIFIQGSLYNLQSNGVYFAVYIGSYLVVGFALFRLLADLFSIENRGWARVILGLMVVTPTLYLTAIFIDTPLAMSSLLLNILFIFLISISLFSVWYGRFILLQKKT